MKKTQIKFVTARLDAAGEVSRNECLSNFISRLAAIIAVLKKEGWQFHGEIRTSGMSTDYVYKLIFRPTDTKPLL